MCGPDCGGGGGTLCDQVPDPDNPGWYRTYAGYSRGSVPGLNSNTNGLVKMNSSTIYNSGDAAAWIGVGYFDASGVNRWGRAGLANYLSVCGGLQK